MRKISQKFLDKLNYNTNFEIRYKNQILLELEYIVGLGEFKFKKDNNIYYWTTKNVNSYLYKYGYEIEKVEKIK